MHSLSEIIHRPIVELIDEEAVPEDFALAAEILQTPIRRLHGAARTIQGRHMHARLVEEADTMFAAGPARNKAYEYCDFIGEDCRDEPDALYSESELWAYVHAMHIYVVRMPMT